MIALLLRDKGTSIEELTVATGWLPHTTRAALTGLRKRGYVLLRKRPEGRATAFQAMASHEELGVKRIVSERQWQISSI